MNLRNRAEVKYGNSRRHQKLRIKLLETSLKKFDKD